MIKATLVATLALPIAFKRLALPILPREVGWLELRGTAAAPGADWLRGRFGGRLIFSMSGVETCAPLSDEERHRMLVDAAQGYDMVDLDADRDLVPGVLAAIPAPQRMITWRGPAGDMHDGFGRCHSVGAALYRIIPHGDSLADVFAPLVMLQSLGRPDTTAYASGADASWSRVLAPHLGAPVLFGSAADSPSEPGELSVRRLIDDYDVPWLHPIDEVFGIIGRSVHHSLSPRLHNGGYRRLARRAVYLPLPVASYAEFHRLVIEERRFEDLGVRFSGATISAPHKEAALAAAAGCSPLARVSNAANNLALRSGAWWADTTDAAGAITTLAARAVRLPGTRVLVVGCGGAGRGIAAGLKQAGAEVTLMNRGVERGDYASHLLGLPLLPLADADIKNYSVVVNATPVGREGEDIPFSIDHLNGDATLIDLVYGSAPTRLARTARHRGLAMIDGRDILRAQVYEQFQLLTGTAMPAEAMDAVLGHEAQPDDELLAISGT